MELPSATEMTRATEITRATDGTDGSAFRSWSSRSRCSWWRAGPPLLPAERAIVILVSIDGFRWDYLDRYEAPEPARLAASGVRAEGFDPAVSVEDVSESLHHRHRPAAREPRHHFEQHARRRHPRRVLVVEPRRARRSAMVGRRANLEYRGETGHASRRRCSGPDRKR